MMKNKGRFSGILGMYMAVQGAIEACAEELTETRLDRCTVQIVCSRCGNNTFTATKITEAGETTKGLQGHVAFGWEISYMGIRCAVCGGEPKLEIKRLTDGEGRPLKERPESGTEAARVKAEGQEKC